MYRRILLPIDGTACSDAACAEGIELAKALGSHIRFLFVADSLVLRRRDVVDIQLAMVALRAQGREILARAIELAEGAGVPCDMDLPEGSIGEVIVNQAATSDLVVLGTRGEGLLRSVLKGSVAEYVIHHVTRPLLLIRSTEGTSVSVF